MPQQFAGMRLEMLQESPVVTQKRELFFFLTGNVVDTEVRMMSENVGRLLVNTEFRDVLKGRRKIETCLGWEGGDEARKLIFGI